MLQGHVYVSIDVCARLEKSLRVATQTSSKEVWLLLFIGHASYQNRLQPPTFCAFTPAHPRPPRLCAWRLRLLSPGEKNIYNIQSLKVKIRIF